MSTWAQLKADVRAAMKDPSGTTWNDAELLVYGKDALDQLGLQFPLPDLISVPIVAGTSLYALDARITSLHIVELVSASETLRRAEFQQGKTLAAADRRKGYQVIGGQLRLLPTPSSADTMLLHVSRLYTQIVDDNSVLEIPRAAEQAFKLLVRAMAWHRKELQSAKIDQFDDTRNDRRDNPHTPIATALFKRYDQQVAALRGSSYVMLGH